MGVHRLLVGLVLVGMLPLAIPEHACAQPSPLHQGVLSAEPSDDDWSAIGLRKALAAARHRWGDEDRQIPLAAKAELLESILWRYHLTEVHQVATSVELADLPGVRPRPQIGSDTSTWNGALLAALSYKYAVTRDAETLERLVTLVQGLRFYWQVTGRPGCYARCVVPTGTPIRNNEAKKFDVYRNRTNDGRAYDFLGNPAKGTYNQLAGGYATLLVLAGDDLPADVQQQVRSDVTELVLHLLRDDYHIQGPDGRRTPHGDLTPVVASVGVPFNGQVAYQIVALGNYFPGGDVKKHRSIGHQFYRLRESRHVYYEDPRKNLICPQRVGNHPLMKGMNDRNHVVNAAYFGLLLELDQSRRTGKPINKTFMYRLGRTMFWGMKKVGPQRNALCTFMWAGLLNDPGRQDMLLHRREQAAVQKQLARWLPEGVEQLRRYPIDRFHRPGKYVETKALQWVDQKRPSDFQWKENPKARWKVTGPPTNRHVAPIDYLAAYWIFRYHKLDRHPAVTAHHGVLGSRLGK